MQCYAERTEGFRPSLAFVQQQTGIPENKVSTVRSTLVNEGFIGYDREQGSILIDWKRIWIYSCLDASLTRKTPHKQPLPHTLIKVTPPPKPIGRTAEYRRLVPLIPMRELTADEEHCFKVLENMTPDEYEVMVDGITPAEKKGVHTIISTDRYVAERKAVQPHSSFEDFPQNTNTNTYEEDALPTRLPF